MILRNGNHPGGIDVGAARNPFMIGSGISSLHRQRSRVAQQLYARSSGTRTDPSLLALAAATVRRAIADARSGALSRSDLNAMVDPYRLANDLPPEAAVPLEDVREWLRLDAARFLDELGVPDHADTTEVDAAYTMLINRLQREPAA